MVNIGGKVFFPLNILGKIYQGWELESGDSRPSYETSVFCWLIYAQVTHIDDSDIDSTLRSLTRHSVPMHADLGLSVSGCAYLLFLWHERPHRAIIQTRQVPAREVPARRKGRVNFLLLHWVGGGGNSLFHLWKNRCSLDKGWVVWFFLWMQ